jgi:cyclophilin family peptidyl-prolyl cis-trans isomerase
MSRGNRNFMPTRSGPLRGARRWLAVLALAGVALSLGCQPSAKTSGGAQKTDPFTQVVIETDEGDIRFEVMQDLAPNTVSALATMILTGTYDDKTFFQRRDGAYLQFGDPDAEASLIPDGIPFELTGEPLDRGTVALGWVGTRSRASHRMIFPLTRLDARLDNQYSVFARVLSGMDVLDRLAEGTTIRRITARLNRPIIRIQTAKGNIVIELNPTSAPNTVARISDLVCQSFYNGLTFHRVEPALIQGGDPNGDGSGGSGLTIPGEFTSNSFLRGSVGMARLPGDVDSADSQFFIMKQEVRSFDGNYTYMGQVIGGIDVVDATEVNDVMSSVTLQFDLQGRSCEDGSDAPPPDDAGIGGQPPDDQNPDVTTTPPSTTSTDTTPPPA